MRTRHMNRPARAGGASIRLLAGLFCTILVLATLGLAPLLIGFFE